MSNVTLMPQTGTVTTGTSAHIGSATKANLQFTPLSNLGFTGTVYIESSTAPNPGINDWFSIAQLDFTAHNTTVDINIFLSNNPWIRARIARSTLGAVSVFMASS